MASLIQAPSCQEIKYLRSNKGHGKHLITGLQNAASAVRAAAAEDDVLFKKARVFIKCRPKRVLFNVSHRLYRKGDLEEDTEHLKDEGYEGVVPPASVIWGERFDQDVLQSSKTLNEDNFWTFVHSVAWRKFSSIRVTEGVLLDSLLYAYYSLVQDGKLYSFTTDAFQKNDSTTNHEKSDKKERNSTIKITFTYYAPSLRALSEIIYHHQGSRVSIDTLAQQNESPTKQPTDSPDVSLDFAWSTEQNDSQAGIRHVTHATPVNPPNSPTPSRAPTQTTLKKRKDRSLVERQNNIVKYPSSYYNLPLVLRNRFTFGMRPKGDEDLAIEGKTLGCRREDNDEQFTPCSDVYFSRETSKVSGYKSSLEAVRASYCSRSETVRLPTLTPSTARKDQVQSSALETTQGDSSSPLRSCLVTPSQRPKGKENISPDQESPTSTRPDSKRTLTLSPNLEYINVVRRVTPGRALNPKLPGSNVTFDTRKLYINWSLDKMRRARRIGKYSHKFDPSQKTLLNRLQAQETDKDYVLGKFLAERRVRAVKAGRQLHDHHRLHTERNVQCEQCLEQMPQDHRPTTEITNHTVVKKLRFTSGGTDKRAGASSIIPPGYADTVAEFRHGCYMSTKQFIIRKEQVTTYKPLVTVTSLTINKIPQDGFKSWQYLTDDAMLDK